MTRMRPSSQRGTALVFTLAAMALVLTAFVAVASLAATVRFERQLDRSSRIASELLRSVEPIILEWLQRDSSAIVLAPDAVSPEVPVLHHRWTCEGRTVELRITAWDQCGMVGLHTVRAGSPIRPTLPETLLRQVNDLLIDDTTRAGLDLVPRQAGLAPLSPFPLPHKRQPAVYASSYEQDEPVISTPLPVSRSGQIALGALVATHQPSSRLDDSDRPRINVNTAPMALVEAAMREAGRGGLEVIVAAREQGRPASVDSLRRQSTQFLDVQRHTPVLLSTSDVWAFRVDVRVDRATRSWWRTYQANETAVSRSHRTRSRATGSHSENPWTLVQSIVITH